MISLAESNMAGTGTSLDCAVRAAAARQEPAWNEVGEQSGVRMWRLEAFQVRDWPVERFGHFHSEDAYLVLHSVAEQGRPVHRIHFWLGRRCGPASAGAAAFKAAELGDRLGRTATLHRQPQGQEQPEFFAALRACPGGPREFHLVEHSVERGSRTSAPSPTSRCGGACGEVRGHCEQVAAGQGVVSPGAPGASAAQQAEGSMGAATAPLWARPMDAVYGVLYVALAASSAVPVLFSATGCRSIVPEWAVTAVCVADNNGRGNILSELVAQWQLHQPAADSSSIARFLRQCDLVAAIVALPLALVMWFGADRSRWQVVAVVHLTIVFSCNAALATAAPWPQTDVEQLVLSLGVGAPLVLLDRWWCEWPFSVQTLQAGWQRSRLRLHRLSIALSTLVVAAWMICLGVYLWDWAVQSHQSLQHLPRIVPHVGAAVAWLADLVPMPVRALWAEMSGDRGHE
eukprot:TRINITY_DN55216_c0_g1_i1.p1 TRINITY_DN55216_c0_g1~~TRINITY_DN55216_c0_g1_i1.p1  ORF type:complete len:501 (+),score=73.26 TRINITY_DN55216_c0_g1_i1:130-1503(+)